MNGLVFRVVPWMAGTEQRTLLFLGLEIDVLCVGTAFREKGWLFQKSEELHVSGIDLGMSRKR